MPVDQQRIRDVLADHAGFVHVHIVDVVDDVDAAALARVGWLDDPNILLRLVLLQLLVVVVEITEFLRENVGVGSKVERGFSELFLHSDDVEAETVLSSDLGRLRELVDLLVLVQTLILVVFTAATGPKQVPLVTLSLAQPVLLEDTADHPVLEANVLYQEFRVLNVIVFALAVRVQSLNAFLHGSVLESDEFRGVLVVLVVEAGRALPEVGTRLGLARADASLLVGSVVLYLLQLAKNLEKLFLPLIFLYH